MDVTTPVAPRVCHFGPFVGKTDLGQKNLGRKDVVHKDGAPRPAPSLHFPPVSGKETTDPVPCASTVVQTPSDAAWHSKRATVCNRRAVMKSCDNEGHLKPCDVKMPIAINNLAWHGAGTLGAVVQCTS